MNNYRKRPTLKPEEKFFIISNAKILREGKFTKVHLAIAMQSGRIIRIFKSPLSNRFFVKRAHKVYDAEGCWTLPGVVDLHVHFREPGEEYKEDFESGSAAAAAGGVTFVADMPNNSPPINTLKRFKSKVEKIKGKSFINYSLYMGVEDPTEISKAINTAVSPIGFKIYYYHEKEEKLLTSRALPKDPFYCVHPEDSQFLKEGSYSNYEEFEKKRPVKAETNCIKKLLQMAKEGYRIHITHITSQQSLELIQEGKKKGLPITTDATPHHLLLDKERIMDRQNVAKVNPPLRNKSDRRSLFEGVLTSQVDAIASDHAPHHPKEKLREMYKAPAGIANIEFMLPLVLNLTRSHHRDKVKPVIRALSTRPAQILGLSHRGKIKLGNFADIVIFDQTEEWEIQEEQTFSKGKVTPFNGFKVKGKVISTFVNGILTYHRGELIKKAGKLISPKIDERTE